MKPSSEITCCIPTCSSDPVPSCPITFHAFPSNQDISVKWIRNINRNIPHGGTWFPLRQYFVCSKHFLETDFDSEMGKPVLKPDSVPTLFETLFDSESDSDDDNYDGECESEDGSPLTDDDDVDDEITNMECETGKNDSGNIENVSNISNNDISDIEDDYTSNNSTNSDSNIGNDNISKNENDDIIKYGNGDSSKNGNDESSKNDTKDISITEHHVISNIKNYDISITRSDHKSMNNGNMNIENDKISDDDDDIDILMDDTPLSELFKKYKSQNSTKPPDFTKPVPSLFQSKKSCELPSSVSQMNTNSSITNPTVTGASPLLANDVPLFSSPAPLLPKTVFLIPANVPLPPNTVPLFPNVMPSFPSTSSPISNNVPRFIISPSVNTSCASTSHQPATQPSSSTVRNKTLSAVTQPSFSSVRNRTPSAASSSKSHAVSTPLFTNKVIPDSKAVLAAKANQNFCDALRKRYTRILNKKNDTVRSLRRKLERLSNKCEALETKCVVRDRTLGFKFVKKLLAIKEEADKGERNANFIFEQIKSYFNEHNCGRRWSPSTLLLCCAWYKKAPYAYDYLSHINLFKLPNKKSLARHILMHPEILAEIRSKRLGACSDDSSSDFEFEDDEEYDNSKVHTNRMYKNSTVNNVQQGDVYVHQDNQPPVDAILVSEDSVVESVILEVPFYSANNTVAQRPVEIINIYKANPEEIQQTAPTDQTDQNQETHS